MRRSVRNAVGKTSTDPALFGLLLVDKPTGPTSHDVVQSVRRAIGIRRVGHTGTLDPFASGLLLLCVGPATRLVDYYHVLPKTYEGVIRLGVVTATDDGTGDVVTTSDGWRPLDRAAVASSLASMVGRSRQRPPAYSAKRVEGRRAHREARAGRPVELPEVDVMVHSLEILEWEPPDARIRAVVSTGTYIRALARDLGEALGCGAHLAELRRTQIGPFHVADAREPGDAVVTGDDAWRSGSAAVPWMPARELNADEAALITTGQAIVRGDVKGCEFDIPGDRVALVHDGRLAAVGRADGDQIFPEKVFHVS